MLSIFDPIKKIKILYTMPDQNVSDEILENLIKIHDTLRETDLEVEKLSYDFGAYLSNSFQVKSAWFPEVKEKFLLTLYFEEHENTHFFKKILEETVSKLIAIPNMTKITQINTPHADRETYTIFSEVIQILSACFFDVNQLHATYNIGLAEILVLGNKGGGKTSIIDYLIHGKFIPQTAPTLTPRVFKLILDQIDFRVLDVCCDSHIKRVFDDHPIEEGKLPQAIVYVVDTSLKKEEESNSISEFNEWINYLKNKYGSMFSRVPVLILFNKIDLNPSYNLNQYKKLYTPKTIPLNLKFATVSAKTGQGLEDNFSWLLKKIKVTEKF